MKNLTLEERDQLIRSIGAAVADGSLDLGGAVKRLRLEVTGLKQATFARMCKISMRALNHLEHGDGNPTLATLEAVFKPFGLRIGLVRIEPIDLRSVVTKTELDDFGFDYPDART
ncbi:helix-turn-helix transcriptional regulator [Pseudomonas sp. CAN2814]|jgi:transcriptional regulator with XRE-family HTH domain|uniref:helix-turn-helix transcriptional regulator n=1 Tax=Pseudomonas sp. CAN1 TaxID=3046726 RepID=UPI00264907CB|nr:helix-turn-helix transcriptional regulator [Pseudomonas sp. CAN1]MDN6855139.1 helix-turn-helix transcriptional regulator [Pseudomonas sp. CAN1]